MSNWFWKTSYTKYRWARQNQIVSAFFHGKKNSQIKVPFVGEQNQKITAKKIWSETEKCRKVARIVSWNNWIKKKSIYEGFSKPKKQVSMKQKFTAVLGI